MSDLTTVLKDYVQTANNPEYGGDWNIINSKFPELANFDKQVLKDYVSTANNFYYGGNWNIINGKFPELFKPQNTSTKINNSVNKKSKTTPINTDQTYSYEDLYGDGWETTIDEINKNGPKGDLKPWENRHKSENGYDKRYWNEDGSLKTADQMHDYKNNEDGSGFGFINFKKIEEENKEKRKKQEVKEEFENKIITDEGVVDEKEDVEEKKYDGGYIISDEEEAKILNIQDGSLNQNAEKSSTYAYNRQKENELYGWSVGDYKESENVVSNQKKYKEYKYGNVIKRVEYSLGSGKYNNTWKETGNVDYRYVTDDGVERAATDEEKQSWINRDYVTKTHKKIQNKISSESLNEDNLKLLYKNPEEYLKNPYYHAGSPDVDVSELSEQDFLTQGQDIEAEGVDKEYVIEQKDIGNKIFKFRQKEGEQVNIVYEDYKGKYRLGTDEEGNTAKVYLDWENDTPAQIRLEWNLYSKIKLNHINNELAKKLIKEGKEPTVENLMEEFKKSEFYNEKLEKAREQWTTEYKYQDQQQYLDFNQTTFQKEFEIVNEDILENTNKYFQEQTESIKNEITEDLTVELTSLFERDQSGDIVVLQDLNWNSYKAGDNISKKDLNKYFQFRFENAFSKNENVKDIRRETEQLYENTVKNFQEKYKPSYNLIGNERLNSIGNAFVSTLKRLGHTEENAKLSGTEQLGIINSMWKKFEKKLTEEYRDSDQDEYGLADFLDQRKHEFYTYMYDKSGLGLSHNKDGSMSDYQRQLILSTISDNNEEIMEKILLAGSEGDNIFDAGDYTGTVFMTYEDGSSENVEGYFDAGKVYDGADRVFETAEKIIKQEQLEEGDVDSFWEGFKSKPAHEYFPILGNFGDIANKRQLLEITDKLNRDGWESLSDQEKDILVLYNIKADSDQKIKDMSSWTYGAGRLTSDMIPYVGEFILTSGAFTLARASALKGLTKAVVGSGFSVAKSPATKNAVKFASWLTGTLAHTSANPNHYISKMYDNMTPEMQLMMSDEGDELIAAITEEGDDVLKAFAKAYGTTWAEFATERMGEAVPLFGKYLKGKLPDGGKQFLERLVVSRYIKKAMDKMGLSFNEAAEHFLKRTKDGIGWNGFMGEVFEEVVNQPISNLIDGNDIFEGMDDRFFGELSISMGTTSLAFGGIGMLASKRNKKKAGYSITENGTTLNYKTSKEFNAALNKLEEQGKLNNENYTIEIDINNDVNTFTTTENLLNKYKDRNNKVNNVKKDFFDLGLASEVELTEEVAQDQNDYGNLTTIEEQLEEAHQERQDILSSDMSGKDKNKALRNNQKKLKNLEQSKMDIISPYLERVEKKKRFKAYKKITENVKDLNEKMKFDTQIIEKSTGEGTKRAILEDIKRQIEENQVIIDTHSDKRTQDYKDLVKRQQELKSDLNGEDVMGVNPETGKPSKNPEHGYIPSFKSQLNENPHGFISKDGKNIFINKSSALAKNGGNINVAAHEFLHRALKTMVENNPHTQLALGSALHKYVMALDPKGYAGDFNRRLQAYQDNSTNSEMGRIEQAWMMLQQNIDPTTGKPLTASQIKNKEVEMKKLSDRYVELQNSYNNVMAEEALTLLSDAFAMGNLNLSNGRLNVLGKIFERLLGAIGVRAKFSTGEDVYNFVADFSDSIQKGEVSRRLRKQLSQRAELKGQLKEDKTTLQKRKIKRYQNVQFSKAVNKDQNELGRAANTPAIIKRNEKLQQDILDAYERGETKRDGNGKIIVPQDIQDQLVENNLPRVTSLAAQAANVGKNIELEQDKKKLFDDFFPEYYIKLADLARTYNAEKVPFGAYMNTLLPLKYSGILEDLKRGEIEATSGLEKAATVAAENENIEKAGKLIKLYKKFGKYAEAYNLKVKEAIKDGKFDPAKENIGRIGVNTVDMFPSMTQTMFGVIPKPGNLTKGDLLESQMFVNKHIETIRLMLPQTSHIVEKINEKTGKPSIIKSIGIPRKVLKKFYNKGPRVGNDYMWMLKTDISNKDILDFAGVTERGKPNLYKKDTNTSQNHKAIHDLTGRMMTNQAAREYFVENNMPLENMGTLQDSMSQNMFSKTVNEAPVGDRALFFAGLPKLGENYRKHGNSMRKAFNMTYGKDLFGDKRGDVIEDLETYIETYEQYVVESTLAGEQMLTLENYINEQTMSLTFEENLRKIIRLPKDQLNFKDKDQIESTRKAVSTLLTESNITPNEAKRFLSFMYNTGNIGGTTLIKNEKGELVYNEQHWQQKILEATEKLEVAKAQKDKKKISKLEDKISGYEKKIEEGVTTLDSHIYGLFKNAEDFNTFVLEGVEETGGVIAPNTKQDVTVKLKTQKDIQAQEDSSMRNKMFLRKLSSELGRLMNEGKINRNDVGMIMLSIGNAGMNTPIAAAAPVLYTTTNPTKESHRYEHLIPRKIITLYFANSVLDGSAQSQLEFNNILDQFGVAIIPKEQDKLINDVGYQSAMPNTWMIGMDPLMRYFNLRTFGKINLDLIDVKTGKPITKYQNFKKVHEVLGENHDKVVMYNKAILASRVVAPSRGMSTFDFDETLIDKGENFIIAIDPKTGDRVKISSGNWPLEGPNFAAQGYEFDFTDFVNVRGGVKGPLFKKLQNQLKKYGSENVYVLTARPAESAPAIYEWLKSNNVEIPLENITGLGNSTGEAKAEWMLGKFAEGYNDMYFVDDALPNVKAVKDVLDQLDIKSSVQQARHNFSKNSKREFSEIMENASLDLNRILEQTKGIKAEARFSAAQAKIRGGKIGRYKFFLPPSAQDFKGLLYYFVGKGRVGERQMAFFDKALIAPFAKAISEINSFKQNLNNKYKTALKEFNVKGLLKEKVGDTNFTTEQAVRVYLWNKGGFDVPGLSKRDLNTLISFVESNENLVGFAETIGRATEQEAGYVEPSEYWTVESILSDLHGLANEMKRSDFLAEWKQNVDNIFSADNMNKIQALYGSRFKEALEDMLYAMEFGTSKEGRGSRIVNAFNNWANQSVGAIMFFNMRSALLQTISAINFINWSDNNPLKAAIAFGNQPQFWKDFAMIFNSDMLKQRRGGQQRGVNETELANAVAGSKNKAKAALSWLLEKGFLPTQIADSFAIASGGASFYRNRFNSYIKQGYSKEQAHDMAFQDFQENAEASQQSARPDMISQQQRSPLGRYILAFKNTPMQYARLIQKSYKDLINRRGDTKTNISKILYYGVVQNLLFTALQSALGSMIGDDDEDDAFDWERVTNSMLDNYLGGLGLGGQATVTLKNTVQEFLKQEEKEWNSDHAYTLLRLFGLSPTIGSKGRKIYSAIQTNRFNKEIMQEMSLLNVDNPAYSIFGNIVSALFNVPLDRLVKKVDNIDVAITQDISNWQRMALMMGWSTWDLGIKDQDILEIKEDIKERKKLENKEKQKKKKKEKEKEKEKENLQLEKQNFELQDKEKDKGDKVLCAAISKKGNRCKREVLEGKRYCTVHEKVEKNKTGEKVQCKKIKSDGDRCKMKTSNTSGLCYYHD